ncbi:DNA phosphorothioation-associated protein 4 [Phormidium sp. CCY1219]|uniref:DNA phosphorothioation-associated protein 4 n=1 Tax=Phormidium sp. CCY1219 TaxID=2886104 RepID=UPI002D1F32A2|nr:DNA phosphorothioation-associated protein 4 [Phormidium sp. CCY1219]MEB3827553.1 DNA phosphorothioation-associated protein 4 [Phormidium sp. CCY1219]
MGACRVKIAKDKAELVKSLTNMDKHTGPFPTYADVMVFAAALGANRKKRVPLGQTSKRDPAPISMDIFVSRGYDLFFKLLAIAENKQAKILSPNDATIEEERAQIFEEYANGGLEALREELRGSVDYTERILLMLSLEREQQKTLDGEEFDLRKFLNF